MTNYILFLIIVFFWSGLPTGYLIYFARTGKDIREKGSGNIGATNVGRLMGLQWFFVVLTLDMLKAIIAYLFLIYFIPSPSLPSGLGIVLPAIFLIGGNIFSPYLKFQGGKGIGTAAGAVIMITILSGTFLSFLITISIFLTVLFITDIMSLASLSAAFTLCTTLFFFSDNNWVKVFGVLIFLIIIITHRKNIFRLIKREENHFLRKEKND